MKWALIFAVCLMVELPVWRSVQAKIIDNKSSVEDDGLPVLNVKFPEDENNKLDSSLDDAVTTVDPNSLDAGNETTEVNIDSVPQVLEEENGGNELKRVKKSNSLTTICVEIKPTSPYEPPYFMCRGTESKPHGSSYPEGGHKPSGVYKPGSQKVDGYGGGGSHISNGYTQIKPSHSIGYESQEEYSIPEHKVKPGGDKYGHGGYGKPSSIAEEGYSSGGYQSSAGHGPHSGYSQSGGGEYSKPFKYQMGPNSYGPPSSNVKPIKFVAPQETHEFSGYGSHRKPGNHPYSVPSPIKYVKPYGGSSYSSSSDSIYGGSGPAYGGIDSHSQIYGSSGVSDGIHGATYKTKLLPSYYGKHGIGKHTGFRKHHGGFKKGSGYHYGGYRTMEEDDDDDEEIEVQVDIPFAQQMRSAYEPEMSYNYGEAPPYGPRPAAMYSLPPPKAYAYPSPAPQVPCGSNLLFGCQPNVLPVPCYRAPAPQQQVVYSVPPPQAAPVMYGPPLHQQPMAYYPSVGSPPQTMPTTSGSPVDQSPRQMSDDQNTKPMTQEEQMLTDNKENTRTPETEDKMRQIPENKSKNPTPPTEPYSPKSRPSHVELVRNMENGQSRNTEEKMSPMSMDNSRQNGSMQNVEMLKTTNVDDPSKKTDSMMRRPQMQQQQQQHMTAMMNGNMDGMQMRQDTMNVPNGGQMW